MTGSVAARHGYPGGAARHAIACFCCRAHTGGKEDAAAMKAGIKGCGWAFFTGLWALALALHAAPPPSPPDPLYEERPGSPDGMGKWFMGREIAHFMSHQGAPWLERPERMAEEQPLRLLGALGLKPGQAVADVGAGSGYLTWRLATNVGPAGRVFATDIQPEMLALLRTNMAARRIDNVQTVLATPEDTGLPPNTLDLIVLVDVYHECAFPFETTRGMAEALKPGGRLVLVEYRGEDAWVPIKRLHKMTEAQVRREMALHHLQWVTNDHRLPRQHILVFRRPPEAAPGDAPAK